MIKWSAIKLAFSLSPQSSVLSPYIPWSFPGDFQAGEHMHPIDDRKLAYIKSNFGEAKRLGLWRIGDGERVEDPVRVAFLVILGKEKANGQGEKMNSEEKK